MLWEFSKKKKSPSNRLYFRPVLAPLSHVLNRFPRFWPPTMHVDVVFLRRRIVSVTTFLPGFLETPTGDSVNRKNGKREIHGGRGGRENRFEMTGHGPRTRRIQGRGIYARFYCAAAVRPPPNILLWINRNAIIIIVIIHTYAYNGYVRVRVYRVYFVWNANFFYLNVIKISMIYIRPSAYV